MAKWNFVKTDGVRIQPLPPLGRTASEPSITLAKAAAAFAECSATWWITYGTLLGAAREGQFLPHDNDLDVAMIADADSGRIAGLLGQAGFAQDVEWANEAGVTNQKFRFGNISIDIYYVRREGEFDVDEFRIGGKHDQRSFARGTHPVTGLKPMLIGELSVPAPADTDRYLRHLYGPDWRTPVLDWNWRFSPPNVQIYCDVREVLPMAFRYWKWRLGRKRSRV